MSHEAGRKVVPNLEEVKRTLPIETIIEAVKEQGGGKPSSKDAGPQRYKKPGKKPATQGGPRGCKKG